MKPKSLMSSIQEDIRQRKGTLNEKQFMLQVFQAWTLCSRLQRYTAGASKERSSEGEVHSLPNATAYLIINIHKFPRRL
jgi:hypothetical protein